MSLLYRYQSDARCDLLVASLWARMQHDGDLLAVYGDCDYPLSAMLRQFLPPNEMFFACDTEGIWAAGWFEPTMGRAFFGCYVRPDKRKTVVEYIVIRRMLRAGVEGYGVLLSITQHKWLLPILERLGYTVLRPSIPGLLNGNDAWVASLTKESCNGISCSSTRSASSSRNSGRYRNGRKRPRWSSADLGIHGPHGR